MSESRTSTSSSPGRYYTDNSQRPVYGGSYRPQSNVSSHRAASVHSGGQRSLGDLNMSRTSVNSHASTVNLGGVDYPVGARVGKSGLFVIGDPEGPLYTSSVSDLRSSHPSITASQYPLVKTTLPYQSRGYSFEHWNWSVIRFTLFILILGVMIALLGATIGLSYKQAEVCNADLDWWRGETVYHIPVGYFNDRDSDNHGDLKGVSIGIGYLRSLGIKVISLSHVLQAAIPTWDNLMSYTAVDARVGFMPEMEAILAELEEEEIHVLLEFPLQYTSTAHEWFSESIKATIGINDKFEDFYIWSHNKERNGDWAWQSTRSQWYMHLNDSTKPILNWNNPRVQAELGQNMIFWIQRGVDGFILKDLDNIYVANETRVYEMISAWRDVIDNSGDTEKKKVLVVHNDYLSQVEKKSTDLLKDVLKKVDLVETPLNLKYDRLNRTYSLAADVNKQLNHWQRVQPGPWVMWRLNGLANMDQDYVPALLLFMLSLPGTPCLVGGQEIRRYILERNEQSPLLWNPSNEPYFPSYPAGQQVITALRGIIRARNSAYALKKSRGFNTEEFNLDFLYLKDGMMLMERTYGRSDGFYYTANFGEDSSEQDWSEFAPFGDIVSNSIDEEHDDNEVRLKEITLQKGQSIVLRIQS